MLLLGASDFSVLGAGFPPFEVGFPVLGTGFEPPGFVPLPVVVRPFPVPVFLVFITSRINVYYRSRRCKDTLFNLKCYKPENQSFN
ncbi:hypothetical protein D3C85_1518980 [compost metagenome]